MKQLNNTFIKENRNLIQGYCTLQEENAKLKKADMEVKASLASLQQEVELYKNAQPADLTKELEKSKANSEKLSKELEESQKRITQLQQICSGGRGNTGAVMNPRPSVMRGRGSLLGIPHPYGYGPLPPGAPGYRFFRYWMNPNSPQYCWFSPKLRVKSFSDVYSWYGPDLAWSDNITDLHHVMDVETSVYLCQCGWKPGKGSVDELSSR